MQVWMTLTLVLQMLAAIVMIGLVLVQHGKGADMGAAFGSGSSGSLFGASGSANFLSRTTGVLATVFSLSSLSLAYMMASKPKTGGSVMQNSVESPAIPAPAAAPESKAESGAPAVGQDSKAKDIPTR